MDVMHLQRCRERLVSVDLDADAVRSRQESLRDLRILVRLPGQAGRLPLRGRCGEVFDVDPEVVEHRSVGATGRILFPQQDVDAGNLHHRELLSLHDLTADAGPEARLGIDVHGIDVDVAERSARALGLANCANDGVAIASAARTNRNRVFMDAHSIKGLAGRIRLFLETTMPAKRSIDVLRDKSLYRSIAFTRKERLRLGLQGLLPHASRPSRNSSIE